MLKYNLIGDNDYIFDPQGTILANRGIDDTFLELDESVTHSYKRLKNINKAADCLIKHIKKGSKMLIVVDPDTDGYTSATIMYQYLTNYDDEINLKWVLHDDKKHGIDGVDIPDDIELLIVPDGGSNDFGLHEHYSKLGVDIIVLDHHEIEKESEYAIIVNSQLGNYPNLNLSGAGIVFKFCQALDDKLGINFSNDYYDLVALGCIADSMSMREPETRHYVQTGLSEINNEFFKALLRKQEFSIGGKVNITTVTYYISPLINAVIRVGTLEEKINLFKAFIGAKELVEYTPRGSDKVQLVSLIDDMARQCTNIKNRQTRMSKKVVNEIEELILANKLNDNQVIFIHGLGEVHEGITGLVANKIAGKYKKPTIILNKENNGLIKGSARGYDKSELKDFKSKVIDTQLFNYAKGHANAYGVEIKKDNLELVDNKLNDILSSYSFEDTYDIDFELSCSSLTDSLIFNICELENLWGKDVDEPFILVRNIDLKKSSLILMGAKQNTVKIESSNINYMLFNVDEERFEEIAKAKYIDVIGRANINVYKGNKTPQLIIDAYSVR